MPTHLTARLAWHNDGWDGSVCRSSERNTYCVGCKSFPGDVIARERELKRERLLAGLAGAKLEGYIPPCSYSYNAFGISLAEAASNPPDFFYGGAKRHAWELDPATVSVWPYEAMYAEEVKAGGFLDNDRRRALTLEFFKPIQNDCGGNLIFYYANYSNPISEEDAQKYVLIGVSRIVKAGNGTQPMPMEGMLRIYFMQNWFNLSDPAAEDSLYDSESMRRFAGIELAEEAIPDETTILRFRHLLERHQLTERMFAEVRSLLEEKRLLLKSGTIVDATIIEAPPSTKNERKARDPEMRQGKKGGGRHFGMKAHIGTDVYGRVHSLATTHAAAADITQLPKLLQGKERALYGDQAYWSVEHREAAEAMGIRYRVHRRPNGRDPPPAGCVPRGPGHLRATNWPGCCRT